MKEQLIEKAMKFGFTSSMLWNYPYKYSADKESLRYCLWLEELRRWLRLNHEMYVEVTVTCKAPDDDTRVWVAQLYYEKLEEEDDTVDSYSTPEEALETMLYHALLILKKEN